MRPRIWADEARTLDRNLARHAGSCRGVRQAPVLPLLGASLRGAPNVIWWRVTADMRISVLSGADDPNYAVPLAASGAERGIHVEFVGNDAMAQAPGLRHQNIQYLNLRGSQDPAAALHSKAA